MLSLYGFGLTPPDSIYRKLFIAANKRQARLVVSKKDNPEHDVVVFFTLKDFFTYQRNDPTAKTVGIVFDSPIKLRDVPNIKVMDYVPDATGVFPSYKPPEKGWQSQVFADLKKQKVSEFKFSGKSTINSLIEINVKGRFLNFFNSLLYSVANTKIRAEYKSLVLLYVFGDISQDQFTERIDGMLKRKASKSRTAFDEIVLYFQTEIGLSMLRAFTEIKTRHKKGENNDYDEIARRMGVDAYELRYLHKTYQQTIT